MREEAITKGRADLHLHTRYSDGVLTPFELVGRAKKVGLDAIGITDHDNVDGVAEAIDAGSQLGVEVIPGVELGATVDGREIHLLGFFIDTDHPTLTEFLRFLREERVRRAERIVDKLRALGVLVTMEKVLEIAGEGSVGRPHIANAVVEEGFMSSYHDVFSKYIGNSGPAFVQKVHCGIEEALSIVGEAGGLSFLAHPGNVIPEQTVLKLIKAGLDGIEVVHPSHSPDKVAHYRGVAHQYYLLESGGSDFHGGRRNDDAALGNFTIPLSTLNAMRRRLFVQDK
jgi:predicted metal-dependent phosphoesterase TrpH